MTTPDREEPCWNIAVCGNIVPFICDDVSQEPGCLPRASYIPEEGLGFVCKCDNVACSQTTCGHFALKECGQCAFADCLEYGTP